mgnify:CR=1 FL=1
MIVKSMDKITNKWATVTPARLDYFLEGVETTEKDWATLTSGAKVAWESGLKEAIAKDLFSKGVRSAGTAKWRDAALKKGEVRWGPGVESAIDDYASDFAPYREVLQRITLPPKYGKNDPRNYERVKVIGNALHAKKVGGAGVPEVGGERYVSRYGGRR